MQRERDPSQTKRRSLVLTTDSQNQENTIAVIKALGSVQRLRILEYLEFKTANVSEIAQDLEMPLATANLHLNVLEKAGLIHSETISARRGVQKMCARIFDVVVLHLPRTELYSEENNLTIEMPIGAYVDHQVTPTCGLASKTKLIGFLDDVASFYEPERFNAQLIWFTQGYLEYRFPYRHEIREAPHSLTLSMEMCSEAAPHHLDWPSDIFVEINGVLIGTWTSPGDFGGERGRLTPEWWEIWNTQYGLLKTWRVNQEGSFIDGQQISSVTIDDLELDQQSFIQVRIGVKPDAEHVGGMNIFGKEFGNRAQDIVMQLSY